jgi:predicted nuclease of restriction endonuclease-like RecB superfamily
MARMNYANLPDRLKRQVDRLITTDALPSAKPDTTKAKRAMTKTEEEFLIRLAMEYGADNVRYEALTFKLGNGHRYTPDFIVRHGDRLCIYEVKGSYRLHSHSRARLAFDQARVEWPCFTWVWAEKQKDGSWRTA